MTCVFIFWLPSQWIDLRTLRDSFDNVPCCDEGRVMLRLGVVFRASYYAKFSSKPSLEAARVIRMRLLAGSGAHSYRMTQF